MLFRSGLPADQITADLNAAVAYVGKLPAANGKVAVAGFCWGGGQAFRYAATGAAIQASLVFYGPAPKPEEMKGIKAPIFGFYGGNDARITAAVPEVTVQMKQAGKAFDSVVYDGAGHGFMRAGEPEFVERAFGKIGINFVLVKAHEQFLQKLLLCNGSDAMQIYNGSTFANATFTGVTLSTLKGVKQYQQRLYFWDGISTGP